MALTVLDASVVIALLDPDDGLHLAARAAIAARAGDDLVIPASALAETLVVPARAGRVPEVRTAIAALSISIAGIGEEDAVLAADLRAGQGLRLPDALVIAVGTNLGAEILTGDRRWAAVSPGIQVISQ